MVAGTGSESQGRRNSRMRNWEEVMKQDEQCRTHRMQ